MTELKTQFVLSARDETAAAFSSVKSNLAALTQAASGITLGGGLGVAAVAGGLITLTKSSIDYMATLHDMSIQTRASVESLSAMAPAAKLAGTSLEEVQGSIQKLAISLGDAKLKGGAKAALFEQLGIDPKTTTDTGKALFDLAHKLDDMPDKMKAISIARDLLGKGVSMPFLDELAQMSTLTAKVTAEQAAAADQFQDNSTKFAEGARQLGIGIATSVLPGMNEILNFSLEVKKEWGAIAGIIVGLGGGTLLKGLGAELDPLKRATQKATEATEELISARKKLAEAEQGAKLSWSDQSVSAFDLLRMKMTSKDDAQSAVISANAKQNDAIAESRRLAQAARDAYMRRPSGTNPRDAAKTTTVSTGKSDLQRMLDRGQANQMDAYYATAGEEEMGRVAAKRAIDSAKAQDAEAKALENLRQKYVDMAEPAQKYYDELAKIQDMLNNGDLTSSQAFGASEKIREQIDALSKSSKDNFDNMSIAADQAARNMQGAFADFLFDPFQDGLGGMLKGFGTMIRRMVAEAAAADIKDALFGKKATGSSMLKTAGSFFSDLFGFATGGSFTVGGGGGTDSQVVAFRATPGEDVTIRTPGQQSSDGGGGSVTIHQTINIDSRSDQASIMAAMVQAKNAAIAEIANSRRRGGAFA